MAREQFELSTNACLDNAFVMDMQPQMSFFMVHPCFRLQAILWLLQPEEQQLLWMEM